MTYGLVILDNAQDNAVVEGHKVLIATLELLPVKNPNSHMAMTYCDWLN